ncbi:hypothetical protein ACFXTH_012944 [Malus domestica]
MTISVPVTSSTFQSTNQVFYAPCTSHSTIQGNFSQDQVTTTPAHVPPSSLLDSSSIPPAHVTTPPPVPTNSHSMITRAKARIHNQKSSLPQNILFQFLLIHLLAFLQHLQHFYKLQRIQTRWLP